eukprot:CAMPEP_0183341262 /NCGR_PEP_ID=MMETSP0164_2-20130417/7538_1 /TAXON_ID=221442 /ORGANISM="Coccolithus pelagicus ssp braarudi, Strain PLY182g" /LENGTH=30 /DNA_ID= /DNA_START= /DNA_END= /DNA_ORIENTATION=
MEPEGEQEGDGKKAMERSEGVAQRRARAAR